MSFFDNARRAFSGRADDYEDERDYEEEYEDYEEAPKRGFFSFLSRNNDNEYDDYDAEEEPAEKRSSARQSSSYSSHKASDRYSSKPSSKQSIRYEPDMSGVEVVVHYPASFDDSAKLVKEVKEGKITIFDVSGIDTPEEARRIVDYICGAAEGMDCPFSRLCPSIFCIAPKGVTLTNRKNRY